MPNFMRCSFPVLCRGACAEMAGKQRAGRRRVSPFKTRPRPGPQAGWHVACCRGAATARRCRAVPTRERDRTPELEEHRMSTFQTGQWIRRGRNIVILLEPPRRAEEME